MKRAVGARVAFASVCLLGGSIALGADALVLRDGRRIEGELVSVRNGTIEFREERGFRGRRTVRFDRDEVRRIELDEDAGGSEDAGAGRGRPGGLREREVVVSGDVAWNDASVEVRAGQVIYFSTIGRVRWGPDRRDGPAGERNSPPNPNRPIPSRPAAALIGKVGSDSTDYFFIGDDTGPVRMRASGRLYLGVNDDYLADNTGNFRVTVYY